MKILIASVALAVTLPNLASADERNQSKAEGHLEAALKAADEDTRTCRRAVVADLKDILSEMSRRLDGDKLERIDRDVRNLERNAKQRCSRGVRRNLEDSRTYLKRAIADADGKADAKKGDKAKPAKDKKASPKIDCWSKKDKSCFATRDGQHPIERVPFNQLYQTFRKTSSNTSKENLMKQVAVGNYFTVMQLSSLLTTTSSNMTKEAMVGFAAKHVVDPKNAFLLRNATTSSSTGDELVKSVTKAAKGFKK